jgi:hypothetical protein
VPGERTESGWPHLVPLSDRALEILKCLPREEGNDHVFIGARKGKGLSNMAMLGLLRRMVENGPTDTASAPASAIGLASRPAIRGRSPKRLLRMCYPMRPTRHAGATMHSRSGAS